MLIEMHTHAEHLQKTTEVKTKGYSSTGNAVTVTWTACLSRDVVEYVMKLI